MKLENDYIKKNGKTTNTWRLNNMIVINQCVSEEIKEEVRKYLETNENKNTSFQNLWDTAKAVLRGTLATTRESPHTETKTQHSHK